MGLFGRTEQPSIPPPPKSERAEPGHPVRQPRAEVTIVARSASVKGSISGGGDLRIDGSVEGTVRVGGSLVVGESGRVKAELHGKTVTVAGSVDGDVTADERIELTPTARVTGNITAPRILIQEGAGFEGQVFMRSPGREPAPKTSSARRPKNGDKLAEEGKGS